jgi:hypothetical protein
VVIEFLFSWFENAPEVPAWQEYKRYQSDTVRKIITKIKNILHQHRSLTLSVQGARGESHGIRLVKKANQR